MWAADNRVGHYGGARCVSLEERQNLLTDGRVIAYVRLVLGEPALERIRFVTLGQEDADDDFGGQLVAGPVEGHSGNGVASKPTAELFVQPRSRGPSLVAEPFPFLHQCNIRRVSGALNRPVCGRISDLPEVARAVKLNSRQP